MGVLEVDDQLELGGLLYRQIAGHGPFQDLVDIDGQALEPLSPASIVGQQTTGLDVPPGRVDRWQRSFSWARFSQILDSVHIERLRIAEMRRRRVFA